MIQGKSCSVKRGLIIYLHDEFKYDYKSKLNKYKTWEGQVIQLKKGENFNKPIVHKMSYNEISPVLSTLENNKNEVIVTGYFNINLLQINDRHVFGEYFNSLTNHSFYPKITLPTRLLNNHATLIYNFFCKLTETMLETTSEIPIKTFSDHQPYFIILNNIKHKTHKLKYIKLIKEDTESIQGWISSRNS